jgi:hypothetical protein
MNKILKVDPKNRIGMEEMFNHPWVLKHSKDLNLDLKQFIYQKEKLKGSKQSNEDLSSPL